MNVTSLARRRADEGDAHGHARQYRLHQRRPGDRAQHLSQDVLSHQPAVEPVRDPQPERDGGIHVAAGDGHGHRDDDRHPDAVRQGDAERTDTARGRSVGDERHHAAGAQEHEQQSADELGRERPQLLGHHEVLEVVGRGNLPDSGDRATCAATRSRR
jgi:hypothetical protein